MLVMDDLFEKFAERQLSSSEVFTISKPFVSKSIKKCTDLAWVNVAKNLLQRIEKQTDVHLAQNIFIFIEISVKAEVKSCMRASAKLNRKLYPQINDLLSYINCIADTVPYPSLIMGEVDTRSLKATLFAAVIDLQVRGVRSDDESALVTELYTKLTTMFESSLETLCDTLLLCRCLVYKNQRKPSVLIPLLRRVLLCSASRKSRFHCTSPMHYIKLLLLAKILLFMVDTNEVLAVHSLIARALRIPDFFRDWLDQNNIPWLSQIGKKHINIKNILKCLTVSTVLETLYGTNKDTYEILTEVNHDVHTDASQAEEELEMRSSFIMTKKKNNKETLMDNGKLEDQLSRKCLFKKVSAEVISNQTNDENKTSSRTKKKEILRICNIKELQNDNVKKERRMGNTKGEVKSFEDTVNSNMEPDGTTTIFTPDSTKWLSPCDKKLKRKRNDSPLDLQKDFKRSLSKDKIINHRKRVRRDSLTFSVTNFLEENIAPVKKEVKNILLPERAMLTKKVSIGIQTDECLLKESEFDEEIQSEVTESTIKSVKLDKENKDLQPNLDSPGSYGKSKMEVTRINSSEEHISKEIRNAIQMSNLLNDNETDNSPEINEIDYSSSQNINEESVSDIEVIEEVFVLNSSSGNNSKMLTVENPSYHERQMEKWKMGKKSIVQPIAHAVQTNEENNVQDQLKKLCIIEKEVLTHDEKKLYSKENMKEFVSNNDECVKNEDENISDIIIRNTKVFHEIFTNGDLLLKTQASQIQNVEESILCDENESEIEMQSLNLKSVADQCNLNENISKNSIKIILKSNSHSNIKCDTKEEMMKSPKISVNYSEKNDCEMMQNKNLNLLIDSKYKGSELKENTAEEDMTKATQNEDGVDSENYRRSLKNSQELRRNIVLAEFQIEKMNISEEDAANKKVNKDLFLSTKDKIDIAENEELEVLSTLEVKGDYGEHNPKGFSVTCSRDTLPASPQQVSNDPINMHPKSSNQCLMSHIQGKLVKDIEVTHGIPAMKQESHRIHKEHTIGQSVSCTLINQSQTKSNGTLPSTTTEDSPRQDIAKNISKENSQNMKQITDMNDSFKNKMNKTEKKNEKLKVGENYGRINYLVQSSRKVFKHDESISSQLGSLAISFGRRLPQVRLDPLLKREMCKGCGVYLVYGVNAKVRHKSKRQKHLVVTCLTCHTIKRFVTNPKHKLWSEQIEAKV